MTIFACQLDSHTLAGSGMHWKGGISAIISSSICHQCGMVANYLALRVAWHRHWPKPMHSKKIGEVLKSLNWLSNILSFLKTNADSFEFCLLLYLPIYSTYSVTTNIVIFTLIHANWLLFLAVRLWALLQLQSTFRRRHSVGSLDRFA